MQTKHAVSGQQPGQPVVQIFAKYPHTGQVKTRLAARIGAQQAMQVHCELLERQLAELMCLPIQIRLELWCTEDETATYYQGLFNRWGRLCYRRQSGADLGQRLDHALLQALPYADPKPNLPLPLHGRRVLQIGTDCPVLQTEHICAAIKALDEGVDQVFIPAEDGGYVLGGYSRYVAGMFDNIEWSTSRVMGQVLKQSVELGLSSSCLPRLWDVDRLEDLQRYRSLPGVVAQ